MAKDDYEIVPYKEIETLKRQIKELRKKSMDALSSEIVDSMNRLTGIMDKMLQFFKTAAEELKTEELKGDSKKIDDINKKLNEVIEQNKVIAEGIVTVADMVKGKKHHIKKEEGYAVPAKEEHIGMAEEVEPVKRFFSPESAGPMLMPAFKTHDLEHYEERIMPPPMPKPMPSQPLTPPPISEFEAYDLEQPKEPIPPLFRGSMPPPMHNPPRPPPPMPRGPAPELQPPAPEKKKGLFGLFK